MTAPSRGSLALLALALAALLPACLGDGAEPSPEGTAGASATATQQPAVEVAADLTTARDLHRDGQYEEALAVYRRIVQVDDTETSLQARYGLAQTYLALGQYTQAIAEIDEYLDSKPPEEDALRAQFLLGRTYAALGEIDEAQDAFRRYADGQGPLALDAQLEIADLDAQAGRHDQALDELDKALLLVGGSLAGVPSSLVATLYSSLADAYRETGEPAKAIEWYELLLQENPSDTLCALTLSRLAAASRQIDDRHRWRQALLQLVETYPASAQAPSALRELLAAGETVDALTQALVHLHQLENTEAAAILDSILQGEPPPSEGGAAYYYRGVIHEREDEPQDALDDYEASLALAPAGGLADDAAWNRARILEELWLNQDAAAAYQELWRAYPDSPFAADAAIAWGRFLYQMGDSLGASAAWHEALPTFGDQEHIARAHLWLGKADQILGEGEGAATHFQHAMDAAPGSFYALRAEALLAGQGATAPSAGPSDRVQAAATPSSEAPEAWLTSAFGPENLLLEPSPFAQPGWLRGQEYTRIGFLKSAYDEFLSLIDEDASRPWSLYRLATAFQDQGLTHLAARAAAKLLATFPGPLEDVPPSLLELAYPQDFMPFINAAAADNDLSPLVLLATIRQESFFDPAAGSPAGALGLTQIIPATAQEIAQQLDRQDFSITDLFRPSVSIEFGAHYLASQVQLFEGNLYFALAAYNAGPGMALFWSEEAAGDIDLFQELIEFAETHSYVRIVLENYAVYRFLYGEADHITLLAAPTP